MRYSVSEKEYYSVKGEIPSFSMSGRRKRNVLDDNYSSFYNYEKEKRMSKYLKRLSNRIKEIEKYVESE